MIFIRDFRVYALRDSVYGSNIIKYNEWNVAVPVHSTFFGKIEHETTKFNIIHI